MDEWICSLGLVWGTLFISSVVLIVGTTASLFWKWLYETIDKLWFGVGMILFLSLIAGYLIYIKICGG